MNAFESILGLLQRRSGFTQAALRLAGLKRILMCKHSRGRYNTISRGQGLASVAVCFC